ncbi:carbohydrate ABC transporter substrate-binding protein (CUT1 family) [Chelatococcus asaccharovorans]|uniref:Carbohydrate ABC transporter substrate-binding protein (CUT1 family) n=2 Tax=Chelatococcus asaccharovorans TaxID=28210 RepID=A0A2V3U209_9HYPH|nr:carbohydrate ABC transporter substrate-binding protein (CUT1 family) [Chelatococcus asaccharovorans]
MTEDRTLVQPNAYEIARVISFIARIRDRFQLIMPFGESEAQWRMVSYLIQRFIEGRPVTITELIQVSSLPYATAHRRIGELIDQGLFERQGRGGKRFDIVPSARLIRDFFAYAREIKAELTKIYVGAAGGDADDYFFGGEHQALALNEQQTRIVKSISGVEQARFLFHDDYYFQSIRHVWSDFRQRIGSFGNFSLLNLDDLHEELIENAARQTSKYDIVSLNGPWVAEFASRGALVDLGPLVEANATMAPSFHPQVWDLGHWRQRPFGLPSYATAQIMAARRDVFERHALKLPTTFEDVLRCGKALHDPAAGRFGIAWNGQEGIDIAHTFMFILGCCGAPIVDLAQVRGNFEKEELNGRKIRALIDSYAAVEALEYMRELLAISPPNVLNASWRESLDLFLHGRAAMTYTWSVHATRFEMDIDSVVKRRVSYVAPPAGKRGRSMSPLGGFVFAVPSNLPDGRKEMALRTMAWMSSADSARAKDGLPLSPLFSLNGDLGAQVNFPVYNLVKSLAQKRLLNVWQRPAIPKYVRIETILGQEVHRILSGSKSINEGLADANARIRATDEA